MYLVAPGGDRIIADKVPQNGFLVRQDGSTLLIALTTYYSTSDRRAVQISGATAVSLRN